MVASGKWDNQRQTDHGQFKMGLHNFIGEKRVIIYDDNNRREKNSVSSTQIQNKSLKRKERFCTQEDILLLNLRDAASAVGYFPTLMLQDLCRLSPATLGGIENSVCFSPGYVTLGCRCSLDTDSQEIVPALKRA